METFRESKLLIIVREKETTISKVYQILKILSIWKTFFYFQD